MSLVRSKLEYAAGTWDPHHEYNINKLERVQRCAARFVCHDFGPCSSVTQMLSDLGWQQLKDRRKHIRLTLLFKIIHDIILVPHQDLLLKANSRTRSSHQSTELYAPLRTHINILFFLELYLNGICYTRTLLIPKPSTNLRVGSSHHPPHPCVRPPPAWSPGCQRSAGSVLRVAVRPPLVHILHLEVIPSNPQDKTRQEKFNQWCLVYSYN